MAETKQKQQPNLMDIAKNKAEEATKRYQLEKQRSDRDRAFDGLMDKYINSESTLGADHFRTNMLRTFLNMLVPLRDLSDAMFDMQESVSALADMTSLMDGCLNFINDIFSGNNATRYGLFHKWKQQRMMRKFIVNFERRMSSILTMINGIGNLSDSMTKAIAKMNVKFTKKMEKQARKKQKNHTSGNSTNFFGNSDLQSLIDKRKKELNAPTNETPATKPTGTTPSAPTSGNGDVDISDIV